MRTRTRRRLVVLHRQPEAWGPWENHSHKRIHCLALSGMQRAYRNAVMWVRVYEHDTEVGRVTHLMVGRHDQRSIDGPWDDLQRIKNELVGEDRLAVEVFPPEAELVNACPVRHLWVYPPGYTLPFDLGRMDRTLVTELEPLR